MINIQIDESATEIGLASMLADLMKQNVEQNPAKKVDFDALKGSVYLDAKDAEVSITLVFNGGDAIIYGGKKGNPDISISTDSTTILDLSNAKTFHGLPNLLDESGQAMLKKIFNGQLKISGMGLLTKPLLLVRMTKVLSVSG